VASKRTIDVAAGLPDDDHAKLAVED